MADKRKNKKVVKRPVQRRHSAWFTRIIFAAGILLALLPLILQLTRQRSAALQTPRTRTRAQQKPGGLQVLPPGAGSYGQRAGSYGQPQSQLPPPPPDAGLQAYAQVRQHLSALSRQLSACRLPANQQSALRLEMTKLRSSLQALHSLLQEYATQRRSLMMALEHLNQNLAAEIAKLRPVNPQKVYAFYWQVPKQTLLFAFPAALVVLFLLSYFFMKTTRYSWLEEFANKFQAILGFIGAVFGLWQLL